MKKNFLSLLAVPLMLASAEAVPSLQLDILGGTYDTSSETVIAPGNPFTLVALYDTTHPVTSTSFFISAAIIPQTSVASSFGSFKINGVTYNSGNVQYGTPPVDSAYPDLGSHSVFPTIYAEIPFSFINDAAHSATEYNTQDNPGGLVQNNSGTLRFITFDVDITGLNSGLIVHFDLYDEYIKRNQHTAIDFAPFSHDAQSGGRSVPDGGLTLALLGAGISGLAFFKRKINA